MTRDQKLNVRFTDTEFEAIKFIADQEGLSLSDFARRAIRESGVRAVSGKVAKVKTDPAKLVKLRVPAARRQGPPPTPRELSGIFRTPFTAKVDAAPFERVICSAAASMRCTKLSVARVVTFIFEQIAREVAAGEVVRVAAFGIFGPYASENAAGVEGCLPRFQAAMPFRNYVQSECHIRDNRNKELNAAKRRRRTHTSSVISAMETIRIHIGAQNDRAQALYEANLDGWVERGGV